MNSTLRLDWCSQEAAKYAVQHWHYSKSLPTPPLVRIGVWEGERFTGVVLFARGANKHLYRPYGLHQTQGAELVRIALRDHQAPVSRIVRVAIKMLRDQCPGLRLLISFADPAQGHIGAIYQAAGWFYLGQTVPAQVYIDRAGRQWHNRMISTTGVKPVYGQLRRVLKRSEVTAVMMPGKHRYVFPLDAEIRARVKPLGRPYPKRVDGVTSSTGGDQPLGGGSSPTSTLQLPRGSNVQQANWPANREAPKAS